ncbi:methionine--tRNA ligase [Burkholderia glumae]|uniref:methionine--tRNA ligase n=1 Tax=Burkholderia glumae TaxID=337 RepID=UPI0003A1D8E9|nr:methionine--tRNA ligase [Burkholderia glumae]
MDYRYITTPIYYVNDRPHMGHAYASVHADVLARYLRLAGKEVVLVTGADEHGEKIAKAAKHAGEAPEVFTARHAQAFQQAWQQLSVSPDIFVRTTSPRHKQVVTDCLSRLYADGEIYLSEYEALYSVGQERFVTEKELVNGKLPEDKEPPILRKEQNYFFKMEKHRDWMRQMLLGNPDLIQPSHYRNEILRLLEEPIGDLSISRPASRLTWGIPIPWDSGHVTYVWFDALLSYVSAIGYPEASTFNKFWPTATHVIGKDILRTHTLFWLSMCRALGIEPYMKLFVSGHLLGADGRKMSKSLGNGVDPLVAAENYGTDTLRYVLLREVSFGSDGVLSNQIIEQRLHRDLADDLGNLASRSVAMTIKYRNGIVPAPSAYGELERSIMDRCAALPDTVLRLVEDMKIGQALERIMEYVRQLNGYIAVSEPWRLAKEEQGASPRLDTVLYTVLEGIQAAANLLAPAMPTKMAELRTMLGLSEVSDWNVPWGNGVQPGSRVYEGILFPKLKITKPAA